MQKAIQHISQAMPGAIRLASELPSQALEKLTPRETTIVMASIPSETSPRVSDLDARQLLALATEVRKLAIVRLGLNVVKEDEEDIITAICATILKHKNLTTKEIQKAVDKALDGDYLREEQTFVHFNIANLAIWIKAYISETKVPVMKKHARLVQDQASPERKKMTPEQVRKSRIEIANMYLDDRKVNPDAIILGGAGLYDGLDEEKIINLPLDRKKELMQKAKILNPTANQEIWVIEAKEMAYSEFINDLAEGGFRLDKEGTFITDET